MIAWQDKLIAWQDKLTAWQDRIRSVPRGDAASGCAPRATPIASIAQRPRVDKRQARTVGLLDPRYLPFPYTTGRSMHSGTAGGRLFRRLCVDLILRLRLDVSNPKDMVIIDSLLANEVPMTRVPSNGPAPGVRCCRRRWCRRRPVRLHCRRQGGGSPRDKRDKRGDRARGTEVHPWVRQS